MPHSEPESPDTGCFELASTGPEPIISTMRKLELLETTGDSLPEIVEDFNERRSEFGITSEDQIVSVSVLQLTTPIPIHDPKHKGRQATLQVVFAYWAKG